MPHWALLFNRGRSPGRRRGIGGIVAMVALAAAAALAWYEAPSGTRSRFSQPSR
jgi:hypothetical protein